MQRQIPLTAALLWAAALPAPAQWNESKLLPASPVDGAFWGFAVGLDGDRAAVGAPFVAGGSASLLERDEGGPEAWGEVAALDNGTGFGWFGWTASLSGDVLAVGANTEPALYLFERDAGGPGAWGQVKRIPLSNGSCCAVSADVDGDTLVVGLMWDFGLLGSGGVYVYERELGGPNNWGLRTTLVQSQPHNNQEFGSAVAICGDTIVCGAQGGSPPFDREGPPTSSPASAYVFERDLGGPSAWGERQRIQVGDGIGSSFGAAVDIRGDTIVIGDPDDGDNEGGAFVYHRGAGGTWAPAAHLRFPVRVKFDNTGQSVSISPDERTIAVGAPDRGTAAPRAGAVAVFERHFGGVDAWGLAAEITASDADDADNLGWSVAAGDGEIFAGAYADDEAAPNAGAVYVFTHAAEAVGYCTAGTSASGCVAELSASGSPSAGSPSGFFLTATGVEGGASGMFYFGTSGRQANSWGNGSSYQCVAPPVWRAGLQSGTGAAGTCDGTFFQDLNARWAAKPQQNPGAGAVVQAQTWYRDPQNTSNRTTSLSDATEFTLQP